jgi:hypothetical protein
MGVRRAPLGIAVVEGFGLLLLCVFLGGCEGAPDEQVARGGGGEVRLDEAVEWEGELTLDENEQTINVIVRAEVDPRGGFLVADEREGYVRRYDGNGRLLAQFAGRGHGPGEFTNLLRAVRLPDGTVAAFDIFQRAAVFDSAGETLLRTFRTPVGPLHAVKVLDDSLVLLGGQIPPGRERLHVWDMSRDSVIASFFSPVLPSRAHEMAAGSAGWVGMDVRGDTLAVVTSLSDTVYLVSMQGEVRERIPLPSTGLRRLDPRKPLPDARGGLVAAREWFGSFSLIADIHWIGDTFVVQYQDRVGPTPEWRLIGLTRQGRRTFEVLDAPNLLAVDPAIGLLYFVSPSSVTPNAWRVARLAPS